VEAQKDIAQQLYSISKSRRSDQELKPKDKDRLIKELQEVLHKLEPLTLIPKNKKWWKSGRRGAALTDDFIFLVRDKEIKNSDVFQGHFVRIPYSKNFPSEI